MLWRRSLQGVSMASEKHLPRADPDDQSSDSSREQCPPRSSHRLRIRYAQRPMGPSHALPSQDGGSDQLPALRICRDPPLELLTIGGGAVVGTIAEEEIPV